MDHPERRIDRILSDGYADGLEQRTDTELRAMRSDCSDVETDLSFIRRLAQARIEILRAELDRRESGGSIEQLIADLPGILGGDGPRSAPADTRVVGRLAPSSELGLRRGLEGYVADDSLVNLPVLAVEEIDARIAKLRELEDDVSDRRRRLHRVIDAVDGEIAARLATSPSPGPPGP